MVSAQQEQTSDITTLHENCKFCATSWPILGFVWKDDISSGIPSFAGGDQNCSWIVGRRFQRNNVQSHSGQTISKGGVNKFS